MRPDVKNIVAITSLICLFMIACDDETTKTENKTGTTTAPNEPKQLVFDKLVGLWKSDDGKSFEQWTKNENGTFQSSAYSINGADTSWNEQASIYEENNNWIFENTVKGQNNGKAVKFTSSILTEITVQFSNPQHDFPTDISYTLADANTLNAFIVGPNAKGEKDTIPFNFTRIK